MKTVPVWDHWQTTKSCTPQYNLENHQTVYFWEAKQHQASNRLTPGTKVPKWFPANRNWLGAAHIKYSDFLCHFIFSKSSKCWKSRAKFGLSSQSYPRESDWKGMSCGQLRLDLRWWKCGWAQSEGWWAVPLPNFFLYITGSISYEDIWTVDGKV